MMRQANLSGHSSHANAVQCLSHSLDTDREEEAAQEGAKAKAGM
jgi:hypothetical protein